MFRLFRKVIVLICLTLVAATFAGAMLVKADGPNAWTAIETNLRLGPGRDFDVMTVLNTNTPLILEGHSSDSTWVLGHTPDNSLRGWMVVKLLRFADGFKVSSLPVSSQQMTPLPPSAANTSAVTTSVDTSAASQDAAAGYNGVPLPAVLGYADLQAPIIPAISGSIRAAMRAVMFQGKALGNNPGVFTKVGDCLTDNPAFLKQIGYGNYSLGKYTKLQAVIDHFMNSPRTNVRDPFDEDSIASHNGFNSSAVLDSEFAPTNLCQAKESPLDCEYRLSKPVVAVIMFGTADVEVMNDVQFNGYIRDIVRRTLKRGIIPLLSTFPENTSLPANSRRINQIILTLAHEKNLPVMNLALAIQSLPNKGLVPDGIHLSEAPGAGNMFLTPDNLQFGYATRNLIVLQSLDAVWRGIIQ